MSVRFLSAVVAAGFAAVALAGTARANDEIKKLVQDEIKAANAKKKEEDTKDMVFKAKWKDGPVFETPDKSVVFKISGRIHLDTVFTDADTPPQGPAPGVGDDFDSATFFRRVRLGVNGEITPYVDWKFEIDFATPNSPQFKDAYVTIKGLKDCVGCWAPAIRFGQQYEPIGLETFTSDNYLTMIERASINNFHPERSIGVDLFDTFWKDRATMHLGVFSPDGDDEDNGFALWDEDDTDGGWVVTSRFTVIPWALDTCRFLHLGGSVSYRNPNTVQYRARPGLGRGPRVLDTGTIATLDNVFLWNAEVALVWNSLHVSAEYTSVSLDDPTHGDPTFSGWYAQVGWFLTGEARAYDFKKGVWGNTKPCCNFLSNGCCCKGAFELAARYDTIDLNEGTFTSGEMETFVVGLNWYLNPNVRAMFDVVFANPHDRSGPGGVVIGDTDITSFLMRWDVHF